MASRRDRSSIERGGATFTGRPMSTARRGIKKKNKKEREKEGKETETRDREAGMRERGIARARARACQDGQN